MVRFILSIFLKKNLLVLGVLYLECQVTRIDNCEYEGVLGTVAGIIGSIQANEVVKEILDIGDTLCGHILIVDALKLYI